MRVKKKCRVKKNFIYNRYLMLHEEKVAASSDSFTQKCNIKQLSTLKRIKYNKREKPRASQGNVATCLKLKSKR